MIARLVHKLRQQLLSGLIRNIIWVGGSRAFNAVISVAYLAVAARALGPARFGIFTLILTYAQLIANLVQFQSWKGVIRYGALHLKAEDQPALGRMLGFSATLDFGSALIGALIAFVGVPLAGPWLGWRPDQEADAALFAAVLLLTTGGTPSGMLRLYDRFDLAAMCEAIGPLTRLFGAIIVGFLHPTAAALLVVWAGAAVLQAIAQWVAALRINEAPLRFRPRHLRAAMAENDRILRFMVQTNLSSSVSMFWMQLGTLMVGAYAGAAQAGGFRLARRLSKGLMRPITPVTLAIYPEFSRLAADGNGERIRMIVVRTTLVAVVLGLGFVAATGVFGREILILLAGKEFAFAQPYLFLLSIATAIDLAGLAFEPVQNAHGRSWRILRAKIIAALVYCASIAVLMPRYGGTGAAIAAIICATVIFVQLGVSTFRMLARPPVAATRPAAAD